LIRYHGIEYTEERGALVQRRCGRQITYRAGLWCGYGFLEEQKNGVFKKTAEFEALWRDRRKKWIDLVHNGNPSGLIELETTLSVSGEAEKDTGRKRVCSHSQSFQFFPLSLKLLIPDTDHLTLGYNPNRAL
jgi:hypothetical protein